jgi:LysR family transcriptional activator of mexEF-oprN operon
MGTIDGMNGSTVAPNYARDLDLNLLRVFVVVAESGSVTAAATRLYLTQPAVSAALARLRDALRGPLFAKQGRGLALTARGEALLVVARPHLRALVDAALSPAVFDPRQSERTVRFGLSDAAELWLLPELIRVLAGEAPRMRIVDVPVHFRSVAAAISSGAIDLALTVADDLPAGTARETLFVERFVCLHDPRHAKLGRHPTRALYLAHRHVVVSYNGDLRGIVEDGSGLVRDVAVSVPSFHPVGALVEGGPLLATVPIRVARAIRAQRPILRTTELPFRTVGAPMELVWRRALDDDRALAFVREHVRRITRRTTPPGPGPSRHSRRSS